MGTLAIIFLALGAALFTGALLKGRPRRYRGAHGPKAHRAPQADPDATDQGRDAS